MIAAEDANNSCAGRAAERGRGLRAGCAVHRGEIRAILAHGPWPTPATSDPSNRVSGQRAAVELGERLFFDTRLSVDGRFSCGTCHVPERNWTDNRVRGVAAAEVDRNTPTLMNAQARPLVRLGRRRRQPLVAEHSADPRPARAGRDPAPRRRAHAQGRGARLPLPPRLRRAPSPDATTRRCWSTSARSWPRSRRPSRPRRRRSTGSATRSRAASGPRPGSIPRRPSAG